MITPNCHDCTNYNHKAEWCDIYKCKIYNPQRHWCDMWQQQEDKLIEFVADCVEAMPDVALD